MIPQVLQLQYTDTGVPLGQKLQWYAILAVGARVFGNYTHSQYFDEEARNIAKELFEETSGITATGFTILGNLYIGRSSLYVSYNRNYSDR